MGEVSIRMGDAPRTGWDSTPCRNAYRSWAAPSICRRSRAWARGSRCLYLWRVREMKENGPIRVLLADDHTMFRQGLKEMLTTDGNIEVVGEAENGEEAVKLAREIMPDVVVLDVDMPIMGAREVLEHL